MFAVLLHLRTDSYFRFLAPAEQTQPTDAGGEERESAREWSRMRRWQCDIRPAPMVNERTAPRIAIKLSWRNRFQSRGATIPYSGRVPESLRWPGRTRGYFTTMIIDRKILLSLSWGGLQVWSGELSTVGFSATAPVMSALVSSKQPAGRFRSDNASASVGAIKAAELLLRTMVRCMRR